MAFTKGGIPENAGRIMALAEKGERLDIDLEAPALLLEGVEVILTADTLRQAIRAAFDLSRDQFSRLTIIVGANGVRLGPDQVRAIARLHGLEQRVQS